MTEITPKERAIPMLSYSPVNHLREVYKNGHGPI